MVGERVCAYECVDVCVSVRGVCGAWGVCENVHMVPVTVTHDATTPHDNTLGRVYLQATRVGRTALLHPQSAVDGRLAVPTYVENTGAAG